LSKFLTIEILENSLIEKFKKWNMRLLITFLRSKKLIFVILLERKSSNFSRDICGNKKSNHSFLFNFRRISSKVFKKSKSQNCCFCSALKKRDNKQIEMKDTGRSCGFFSKHFSIISLRTFGHWSGTFNFNEESDSLYWKTQTNKLLSNELNKNLHSILSILMTSEIRLTEVWKQVEYHQYLDRVLAV
jgi:hypothetical protein